MGFSSTGVLRSGRLALHPGKRISERAVPGISSPLPGELRRCAVLAILMDWSPFRLLRSGRLALHPGN
jgi:hypothetical protein